MNLTLPAASDNALDVDHLLWALLAISGAVLALVLALLLRYVVKYRAGGPARRGKAGKKSWIFETAWTASTLLVFLGLFVWGAKLYVRSTHPPADALQIYVIAKQWMWKVEHAGGQREINSLHVPVGRAVELVMTSEDVIHDFSVPAFRIKHDVLPDRYETLWFKATRPGSYHLFCTQFCGVDHSKMIGEVVALAPPEYAHWLERNGGGESLAREGADLFIRLGCDGCHGGGAGGAPEGAAVRAPPLAGLYGSPVVLANGAVVLADERYIHDAIVQPERQVAAGYEPIMPSFAGQIGEEDLVKLVAYIKSLAPERPQ
jgi:cytochrome c oxidase subunit 2